MKLIRYLTNNTSVPKDSDTNRYVTNHARTVMCLIVLIASFSQVNALTIQMKKVANINHEEIRLIDLIESWEGEHTDLLKIQNILIERLPYQKRMLNIPSNSVIQKIKLHNPDVEVNIPMTISAVRWSELTLSTDRIRSEAEQFLSKYYTLSEDSEIAFMNTPRVTIPTEDVFLLFDMSRTTENTSFIRLDARVLYNGETVNVFNLTARVQERQYLLSANRSIRKGQKISLSDFTKVSVSTNPNNAFLTHLDDEDELIANNFISKGSYLRNTDVVGKPFVNANDLVTVLINSKAMQMTYQAVSRANGWLGDRIMLTNPDSRQTFFAEVIDKNIVLINLEN
jgi:flagella basal body P-ring formation protein FlgA